MGGGDDPFRDVIREAERRAERLIGVLRILVAVALAIVFNVALGGTAVPDDPVLSRQIVLARITLGSCLAIGILALFLSSRRRHRLWYAFAFVTADVIFVLVSLWVALSNTDTPAAYVIVLPSIWLVPLILAFNSLRYSAGVQVYGGVLLISGLVGLGVLSPAGPAEAAADIRAALFQTPPNTMRLAMIAVTCAVLSLAVMRGRQLLYAALREERRRQALTQYLPPQIARIVEASPTAELRKGRRQQVALLFVDIRGFTTRTEDMAPEDVSGFLATYRGILRNAAHATGGIIDKFVGDGALLVFGVPEPSAGDAARALTCATRIVAEIADYSARLEADGEPPLRVGIGVHCGEAFVGAVGDDERLEFTVVGDVVNVAARMESATKEFGATIIASDALLSAAHAPSGEWTSLNALSVRGRHATVPASMARIAAGGGVSL